MHEISFAKRIKENEALIILGNRDDILPTRVRDVDVEEVKRRKQKTNRLLKLGIKCPKVNAKWAPAAREMLSQGYQAMKILTSERVPNRILRARDYQCSNCIHATTFESPKGRINFCQCCGCGQWSAVGSGSDCHSKNKHAANVCPMDPPKFEEFTGHTNGRLFSLPKVLIIMVIALWSSVKEKLNGHK